MLNNHCDDSIGCRGKYVDAYGILGEISSTEEIRREMGFIDLSFDERSYYLFDVSCTGYDRSTKSKISSSLAALSKEFCLEFFRIIRCGFYAW